MKTTSERIGLRLRKDRPTTTLSIRLPEDVVEELTEIAPTFGVSGPLPLMRAYIGADCATIFSAFRTPRCTR